MTQKEIDNFLANTKVYVNGKSKEIQEKLFSFGYCWCLGSTKIQHTEKPFIYISEYKNITFGNDMVYFTEHKNREITADEILSLKLDKPEYRPFKNIKECLDEMLKHQPFGWVFELSKNRYVNIEVIENYSALFGYSTSCSYGLALEIYKFADGAPFGVKE